jgi:predicted DNA-binding transcriptional regulator YafY
MRIIEALALGLSQRRLVRILYKESTKRARERTTEPYGIEGGYYLGFCLQQGQFLRFNCSNIMDAEVLARSYEPRPCSHSDFSYA